MQYAYYALVNIDTQSCDVYIVYIFIVYLLCVSESHKIKTSDPDVKSFPDDFLFETATASYQIEAAWNEDEITTILESLSWRKVSPNTVGGLNDENRIHYIRGYLSAMLDAMQEGSDIRAYTVWSLLDNFKRMKGYVERFGLYEVDYKVPERNRTSRKSASVYKEIVRTHSLDLNFEPSDITITIDEGH